jgi:hypothetical protein
MTQYEIMRRFLEGGATRDETKHALIAAGYRDERGAEAIVRIAELVAARKARLVVGGRRGGKTLVMEGRQSRSAALAC